MDSLGWMYHWCIETETHIIYFPLLFFPKKKGKPDSVVITEPEIFPFFSQVWIVLHVFMRTLPKCCFSEHTPHLSLPCLENISKWCCQGKASFTFCLGSFPRRSEALNSSRSYWSGSGARSLVTCSNRYNKNISFTEKACIQIYLGI